ncbi:YIP1 family protein [candidate division WOR-3 bacterium]|uniref:YIP1 family protein n=1 Tax=candidate division WOR-3 bacterium TaxID=2052148 RepID=A0A660SLS5_UNCW3|nr:MAG: YIP1 family protein [candidate division WOR-3 bacterium]
MDLKARVKAILFRPKEEWPVIAGESTNVSELYQRYILILAAIGPVASIIGMSIVGVTVPMIGTFRVPLGTSLASAIVRYIISVISVYILALIIDALAPSFAGEKNRLQALKVAAYSLTPFWVVGILSLIPALGFLQILGLYSFYLLYLGLPVLMKSPKEKSLGYTIVVIIVMILISLIIGAISGAFVSYPGAGLR